MTLVLEPRGVTMPCVGSLKWHLPDLLEKYDVSPYQLANEMGGHTKVPMLYRLANRGSPPSKMHFSTVEGILSGLRSITGEDIQLHDLLEYIADDETP